MDDDLFTNEVDLDRFCRYVLTTRLGHKEYIRDIVSRLTCQRLAKSAVLIPFWQDFDGKWQIVLTRRSQLLSHHAGQVAFPGGRYDKQDNNLIETALRETNEEINVSSDDIMVYGKMPSLNTLSGFSLTPVIAKLKQSAKWVAQEDEVAEIFTLPVQVALNANLYRTRAIRYKGLPLKTVYLPYLDYDIWGASATLLYRLARARLPFQKREYK